jgi:V/A-type H+/Na+-transporting ATPase subunit I
LSTEPMQKIRIIALGSVRYELISALHNLGIMHLSRSKLHLADDIPSDKLPEISDQLVRMKSALSMLGAPKGGDAKKPMTHLNLEPLLKETRELRVVDEIFKLTEEKRTLKESVKEFDNALALSGLLSGLGVDFSKLKSEALSFRAFTLDKEGMEELKDQLKSSGIKHELMTKKLEKNRELAFIAFDKKQGAKFEEVMKDIKSVELNLNDRYVASAPEAEMRKLVTKGKTDAVKRLGEIEAKFKEIKDRQYMQIAGLTEMLDVEYERATVSAGFKKTGKTIVVEGWIPKKRISEVKEAVARATNGKCAMEELEDKEVAPSMMSGNKLLKPFEFLMDFYSVPRSDELNPTIIFMITLAIAYGIMISDVGYGLMSIALAWLIVKSTPPDDLLHNVAQIWEMFSIPAIFFGIISNTFLGFAFLPAPYTGIVVLDWIHGVPALLLYTLLLGVGEVILGEAFGVYNRLKHHEPKLAISKFTSILVIVFGFIAVGGGFFKAFDPTLTFYSTIIAVVSVIITAATSGIEAVEIPSLMAHPLSYSRLLGFGLASIILSQLINKAFTPSLSQGPVLMVVFGILFITLHSMNMLLSIFEGMVQGARLGFVEFFSKFYIGGGLKFKPYRFNRRYTKE